MTSKIATEAGYYNGKFLKAGMSYPAEASGRDGDVPRDIDLSSMTKDELIAEAKSRGIEVDASKTKAEITAAIEAGSR
ncbi:SAP domain-containing protein [Rhizobium sp. LC145]|uniref:SAP domain-containing protein n=1 Tax=Rhizobium sp. LC145 TaxID=1120688 RepID=UPI00062A40C4|nr:SAP domain-containing protein [Rhizobium sp. LC145]KKX24318.1 hypothetical protein YH62_27575 [Rhizobium sp. LC145]TKT46189.1 hypothetical protein FDR95_23820 [Rhizobiaceae bacterium LC148]